MAKHEGALGSVYDAKSSTEVAKLYDGWAATYDDEMARFGYRHPTIGLALLSRHVPKGSQPILDAGAGTGLLGEWLAIMGYAEVEALDISAGMLDVARKKNVYSAYHQLALGGVLPFPSGHFAAVISVGVFTTGHVGAEGLDELIRICRTSGCLVLTVKETVWNAGFGRRLAELTQQKKVVIVEETAPYISMPGEAGTTPSKALVLRVL